MCIDSDPRIAQQKQDRRLSQSMLCLMIVQLSMVSLLCCVDPDFAAPVLLKERQMLITCEVSSIF